MFTTLCVNATDVDRAKTTHVHKYKPSTLPELGCKHDIAINMEKMAAGQTSEKKARYIEETHEMTLCLQKCKLSKME